MKELPKWMMKRTHLGGTDEGRKKERNAQVRVNRVKIKPRADSVIPSLVARRNWKQARRWSYMYQQPAG